MVKILIVEDSATQRSVYKAMLTPKGYTVLEAADGEEGLRKAQAESPDVIISDISMPAMDGLEMIRALKTNDRTKYIPVICASAAFHDLATKIKALTEAGAEEFFYLPQSEEELLLKVAVMLRIRKLYLDLLDKNKQLKIFNDAAVGREMIMIEQKEKIEQLEKELKRYKPGI